MLSVGVVVDLPFNLGDIYLIITETTNLALLYSLGIIGWFIGKKLHLPAAAVLGGILLVGSLRIMDVGLPFLHNHFILVLQILLGIMIGARFDRQALASIGSIALPSGLISAWALAITILFGIIIALISPLEVTTGILSSSIGGLPEMIVLAHETHASPLIVVLFQIVRIFITALLFPFVLKALNKKINPGDNPGNYNVDNPLNEKSKSSPFKLKRLVFTLLAGGVVGWIFIYIGVPAGGLVGSMLLVIGAIYFQLPIEVPPARTFNWFLVGIGLMVTNQVHPETLQLIFSRELIVPLIVSLILTYASSTGMAYILHKLTHWDFVICLMSSAPGGIAFFTGLAIEYGYNPVNVSLLHLSRVITLKLTIPFIFMLFY